MAVWSSVKLSTFSSFRLDAEYYTPQNLRAENAVKSFGEGWNQLQAIAEIVTDGDHLARDFQDSGVLFLTSEHFAEMSINYDSGLFISPAYEQTLARARSEPGAIYLTKTGAHYGKAAVCPPGCPTFNISADVAKIKLKPGYDPCFVALYLNSAIGFALVRRESTGGTRDRIVLENLRTLPVPNSRKTKVFSTIVEKIWAAESQGHASIAAAESRLMEALRLDVLDLSPQKTYVRRFRDLQAEARFDAEYFTPKYQKVIARLRERDLTLADVASVARRIFKPAGRRIGSTFNYIEIGSLTGDGEADAEMLGVADAPSRAKWIVKPGDIITSTVRPIRRLSAMIRPEQDGFVCSSGFAVLTPKGIEPEVLLTFLRLPIICELLDLNCTASMYPAIPEDRLMRMPFAMPDTKTRKFVVEKVREAIEARREAARLLEQAKKTVEGLIAGGGDRKERR